MSRYFVQRKPNRPKGDDWEWEWPCDVAGHIPTVCDHEAVDTGLVDSEGYPIMRAPNPIGFIW